LAGLGVELLLVAYSREMKPPARGKWKWLPSMPFLCGHQRLLPELHAKLNPLSCLFRESFNLCVPKKIVKSAYFSVEVGEEGGRVQMDRQL